MYLGQGFRLPCLNSLLRAGKHQRIATWRTSVFSGEPACARISQGSCFGYLVFVLTFTCVARAPRFVQRNECDTSKVSTAPLHPAVHSSRRSSCSCSAGGGGGSGGQRLHREGRRSAKGPRWTRATLHCVCLRERTQAQALVPLPNDIRTRVGAVEMRLEQSRTHAACGRWRPSVVVSNECNV
jgi:hypothetical protein